MSDLFAQLREKAIAQGNLPGVIRTPVYSERNSDGSEISGYTTDSSKRNAELAKRINKLYSQHSSGYGQALADRRSQGAADIDAARQTALQQQMAARNTAADQANQLLATPVGAPQSVPNLAPLQEITGVALNPTLSGGNAAETPFFLNPDSTASRFSVGAPVGGGGIGPRQRASTDKLVSETETFGGGKKDQL